MKQKSFKILLILTLILALGVVVFAQRQRPPEYDEVRSATNIKDPNDRIKALEELLAKYPESQLKARMEDGITEAKIELCSTVADVLALQEPVIEKTVGMRRIFAYYSSSSTILDHPNLAGFDAVQVTAAVQKYTDLGLDLAKDEEFLKTIPENYRPYAQSYGTRMLVVLARPSSTRRNLTWLEKRWKNIWLWKATRTNRSATLSAR